MQGPRVKSIWKVTLAGGRAGHRICGFSRVSESGHPVIAFSFSSPNFPWLERESVTAAVLKGTVEATPPLVTGYDDYMWVPWMPVPIQESAAHCLAMDNCRQRP